MISLEIRPIQAQLEAWPRMVSMHMLPMVPRHDTCEGHLAHDPCINASERVMNGKPLLRPNLAFMNG